MFNCRICSTTPFASLLGIKDAEESNEQRDTIRASNKSNVTGLNGFNLSGGDATSNFNARSADEISAVCQAWEEYVHPRAKEFWSTSEQICEMLRPIARHVDRSSDPILGDEEKCVIWHGEKTADEGYPILYFTKPGESRPTATYVTRTLAMMYADDESFEELQKKQKVAFKMACDNTACINLTHISLD